MGKVAFLFSGQGAQYVGMGNDIQELSKVKEVFKTAEDVLGFSVSDLCNDEERINITEFTQPAILTVSVALYEEVKKHIQPDAVAGLSLGEYSAMVASGVLSFEDAVALVHKRGRFMTKAVPTGVGSMAAIIGLESNVVEDVVKDIEGVYVSNYNCPKQYVIGGYKESIVKAVDALKEAGARRAVELVVSGPFHTPLLKKAAEQLQAELETVPVNEMITPIVMNYTGDYLTGDVKELMVQQVMGSVRFEETIKLLIQEGFDTFIEIGPGKILSGFVKKVDRSMKIMNVEDKDSLTKVLSELEVKND